MGDLVTTLTQGVVFGSVYAIAALGFAMVYNATSIFHVAYAGIANVGALAALAFGAATSPLWLIASVPLALAGSVLVGCLIYLAIYRPMTRRGANPLGVFVAALGANMTISALLQIAFGPARRGFAYETLLKNRDVGPLSLSVMGMLCVVLALLLVGAVAVTLERTLWGRQVRAVSSNVQVAELAGIQTKRVLIGIFATSSAIAAVAGILLGMMTSVNAQVNPTLALLGAIAVLLAGKGSYVGAYVGGISVGIVQGLVGSYLPGEWATGAIYGAFVGVALIRPQGLLSRKVAT